MALPGLVWHCVYCSCKAGQGMAGGAEKSSLSFEKLLFKTSKADRREPNRFEDR